MTKHDKFNCYVFDCKIVLKKENNGHMRPDKT